MQRLVTLCLAQRIDEKAKRMRLGNKKRAQCWYKNSLIKILLLTRSSVDIHGHADSPRWKLTISLETFQSTASGRLPWVLEAKHFTHRNTAPAHVLHRRLPVLNGAQSRQTFSGDSGCGVLSTALRVPICQMIGCWRKQGRKNFTMNLMAYSSARITMQRFCSFRYHTSAAENWTTRSSI